MKILYLITQADGGGAQNYVLAQAKYFHGIIAAGNEATELFEAARSVGLETHCLEHLKREISPLSDLRAILEIRELIKNLRPDIVHLNSTKAGFLGSLACWNLKVKVIFTAHGFIFLEPMSWLKKSFYMALEKLASEYRDYIITVSEKDKESALLLKLISKNKISTIYNGLDKIHFLPKEEAKQTLRIPSDRFIFGTIANFYKTKGLDVLIEAVNLLPTEIKNKCLFVIIGNGPEFENCNMKIGNLKLTNSFLLSGKIPTANQYLKAFDAFILPSRKEGFPYVLLEAMQAALPIIATTVGGVTEALKDNGIVCPPENPKALAEAIKKMFLNQKLQELCKINSLERSKKFTLQNMLQETEKVYTQILKDNL